MGLDTFLKSLIISESELFKLWQWKIPGCDKNNCMSDQITQENDLRDKTFSHRMKKRFAEYKTTSAVRFFMKSVFLQPPRVIWHLFPPFNTLYFMIRKGFRFL